MTNDANHPAGSRILVIDDTEAIHEDFRKIFASSHERSTPSKAELALFGDVGSTDEPGFQIDSAYQGDAGLAMVRLAQERHCPYAMAFVDVRMPPGWDGIETTARIWQQDPDIQIVICTAYSDYSWNETMAKLGRSDRLVILKKPFDTVEVVQLATALTEKWRLARQSRSILMELEQRVSQRTHELVLAGERLQASEAQYRLLFDSNPHPMWVYELETLRFVTVNGAAVEHYGYTEQQFLGMTIRDIRPLEDTASPAIDIDAPHGEGKDHGARRHRKRDGSIIDVETTSNGIVFDGRPARLVLAHDMTERKQAEIRIKRLNRVYAVLSQINALIVREPDRDELFRQACRIAVEVGAFKMAWIGMIDPQTLEGKVVAWHGGEQGYVDQVRLTTRDGTPDGEQPACRALRQSQPVICNDIGTDSSVGPLRDEMLRRGHRSLACFPLTIKGRAEAVIVLFAGQTDVFDAEETRLLLELADDLAFAIDHIGKQERLDYLAYYDVLTGLANRFTLEARLTQAMAEAKRHRNKLALMFVDLDRFKVVNDTLGHGHGDRLLNEVARLLTAAVRKSDTVARLGGDEFVMLLIDVEGVTDAAAVAVKVIAALNVGVRIDGHEIRPSASIGISVFPDDGEDVSTLMRNADTAMYHAKSLGGGNFRFYAAQMNERMATRFAMEADLRRALENGEFEMHYQAQVSLSSGAVTGAEALLRWRHPGKGMVSPADFIPLAEETGLIEPLGEWVIGNVCRQVRAWLDAGLAVPPVAVNLSARQFRHPELVPLIARSLAENALDAVHLVLEITESAVMHDVEAAVTSVRQLKALGVRMSLDDFGTGYSSLSQLKRFPIDHLKIDQSFVRDLITDPDSAVICDTIIGLAHNLKMTVIAEGVETEAQMQYLRGRRCDEMQGYFFSKPIPAQEYARLLEDDRRLPLPLPTEPMQRALLPAKMTSTESVP